MNTSKVRFDVTTMTLTVSKKFFKQASIPFTEEYQIIKTILADYPNCKVVTKQQHNHCKYSNPTYEMMIACIQMHPNANELMDEFMRVRNFAHISRKGYNFVRSWFFEQDLMSFNPIHTFCDKTELAA